MEQGTEIANADSMDAIVAAFNNDDMEAFMEASGQGGNTNRQVGLPRLNINYDAETEDGQTLPRGSWKMYLDGKFIYAEKVSVRFILRMFEYSLWDQETGTFASKSVQNPTFSGMFPDTVGGNKCGRLTREEENTLDKDDPRYLASRAVVCNQVIYGKISGDFKDAAGNAVVISDQPVVAYFKRSGFKPIGDFINGLAKQKKLMQKCEVTLTTHRHKNGSVTFWTPVPTLAKEVDISQEDKDLMATFVDTVKGHNESVMNQHREAVKLIADDDDIDLAADFVDANAA
tara:strand:- start:5245 stop:6105 length:861 start_codon:yes stop_codon:yes gene_type:complete